MPSVRNVIQLDGGTITGLAELRAKLGFIKQSVAKGMIRRSLYKGAKVIETEARLRAPKRTGALKKAITATTNRKQKKPNEYRASVTIVKKAFAPGTNGRVKAIKRKNGPGTKVYQKGDIYPRNYAHLVEFGTKPHQLGKGSSAKITANIFGRSKKSKKVAPHGAQHPGARPRPFMQGAYDAKKLDATRAVVEGIRGELDNLVRQTVTGTPASAGGFGATG